MTKIMLVEDDNNLREIYEARLAAEGFDIVAAQDGEAALAIAAKEKPDLIISDVMMPKISGFEMLDILRNTDALRNVKIIMLTALGQAEDSERANHLGADRYLIKSQVTLEDIVNATHELLEGTPPPAAVAAPGPDADSVAEAIQMPQAPEEPVFAAAPEVTPAPASFEPAPAPVVAPADFAVVEPPVIEPAGMPIAAEPVAPVVIEPPVESSTDPLAEAPLSVSDPVEETFAAPADISVAEEPVAAGPVPASYAAPQTPVPAFGSPEAAGPSLAPVGGSVVSIPVTDDDNQVVTGDSTDSSDIVAEPAVEPVVAEPAPQAPELHPISNLPITPAASTVPQQNESPATDYTSPDSFNQFQPSPDASEADTSPAQSNADEVASMQDQINAFIQQTDTVSAAPATGPAVPTSDPFAVAEEPVNPESPVAEEPTTSFTALSIDSEETANTPDPSAVFAPSAPSVPDDAADVSEPAVAMPASYDTQSAEPVFAPAIDTSTAPDMSAVPVASASQQTEGSFSEPIAEELTNFSAPVIAGPPNAEQRNSDADTELVESAAQDLMDNTTEDPSASSESVENTVPQRAPKKIISPMTPSDPGPNIHQLLELEQAKSGAQQAAAAEPTPNVNAYAPSAQFTPQPPVKPDDDPANISL